MGASPATRRREYIRRRPVGQRVGACTYELDRTRDRVPSGWLRPPCNTGGRAGAVSVAAK